MENRNERLRAMGRWGLLPTLAELGILALLIVGFVLLRVSDWAPRLTWVPDRTAGGEAINDPNAVRFCYMLLTLPLTAGLLALSRRGRSESAKFWPALLAGITAWQGIGESSWHFGVPSGAEFVFFPKIEGVQGTTALLLFLPAALYVVLSRRACFSMRTWLLSFGCNWLGHWVLLGAGGLIAATGWMSLSDWLPLCGALIGGGGAVLTAWRMYRVSPEKQSLLLLSIVLYMALGVLMEGCMGIASGLE
ncbi:MAG: hypothetical protein Q4E13_09090 [Clostridia bacterium]|nr:hypothetical protein [Clostridia bacterium]